MFLTVQDGSSNINLASEQVIVRSVVSYTPSTLSFFPVLESNETDIIDEASIAEIELILDNLMNREEEPEDAILVRSGILQRLIAQAQQKPSLSLSDWERELDEL